MTSLSDYFELLRRHDGYFEYSDDPRVYDRGQREKDALLEIREESEAHRELYNAWHNYRHNGAPRPAKPEADHG